MNPVIFWLFWGGCFFLQTGKENPIVPAGKEGRDSLSQVQTDSLPAPFFPADTCLPFNYENVRNYIFRRMYYPPAAKEQEIEGTVVVGFRITESGIVDRIRVVRHVHPLLDSAAIRLIRDMPEWRPVYVRGEPTAFEYEVPVIFELIEPKP
ncbi:MAG: energy transducer TonB [Culturomica sp.]|jgi:TonB family protein|nr:energy transducer TonB [Culturomica sp.]